MYDLLDGVRVLDVSLLAPSMLGMRLAELGADVIKVEQPPHGDRYRTLLAPFRGIKGAPGIFHLFANRGKRSLSLDLQKPSGREIFLELVTKSDVVIVGIRPNAMDRWGLTYEAMREVNPKIVYCLLSGLGSYGPYKDLGTHGAFFDSYAGITPVEFREEDGLPYIGQSMSVGTIAAALFAANGVLAALLKAGRTGQGSRLEVAQTDAAVLFQVNQAAPIVAGELLAVNNPRGSRDAVRYQNYETSDGKYIMFFPFEAKFWTSFCEIIGRPDLLGDAQAGRPDAMNNETGNETLRRELVAIFKTRTQTEWTDFFLENDVPGGPIYDLEGALEDAHFLARDNLFEQDVPGVGLMQAIGTPIKVEGQDFDIRPAPRAGEHTDEVLKDILGYGDDRVAALRQKSVIS